MPSRPTPRTGDQIKMFATFLLIYALFMHFVGWNEQTRVLSAISIADENTLDINTLANFTGDRAVYGGNYYSDKPPGVSMFLLPAYSLSEIITSSSYTPGSPGHVTVPHLQFNATILYDVNPGTAFLATAVAGTFMLAALPGALAVVLMYKILSYMGFCRKYAAAASAIFGTGTILLSYSTVLTGGAVSAMLVLAALLVYLKLTGVKRFLLCGCVLGIAATIDYLSMPFSAVFIWWLVLSDRKAMTAKTSFILAAGMLLGASPMLVYNFLAFGSPIAFYGNYIDPAISPCTYGRTVLSTCPDGSMWDWSDMYKIIPQVLWNPYRGAFFYMPFLLMSFVGLWHMRKSDLRMAVLIMLVFVSYVVTISFYGYWFGGATFGPKYMLIPIVMLSIPVAHFFRSNRSRFLWSAMLVLFALSVFQMFLGTSAFWEGMIVRYFEDHWTLDMAWYKCQFSVNVSKYYPIDVSFNISRYPAVTLNPLYDHYLPAFMNDGPRSRLLEGLLKGGMPDIRDSTAIGANEARLFGSPYGIVTLRLPFLALASVVLVLCVVWSGDLSKVYTLGRPLLLSAVLVVSILAIFSRFGVSGMVLGNGWLPKSGADNVRWMSDEAKIYMFSNDSAEKYLNLSMQNYGSNGLEVYMNGKLVSSHVGALSILERVNVSKGENVLELRSSGGCKIPLYEESQSKCRSMTECYKMNMSAPSSSYDSRCLGAGLRDLELMRTDAVIEHGETTLFSEGWYEGGSDGVWSDGDSKLFLISNKSGVSTLRLSVESYHNPKTLEVSVNENKMGSYMIENESRDIVTGRFYLATGENDVVLSSPGCSVPTTEEPSGARCISFLLKDVVVSVSDFEYENFFPEERDGGAPFRWFGDNGKIYFSSGYAGFYRVGFNAWTTESSRDVGVYVDGTFMRSMEVSGLKSSFEFPLVYLQRGVHFVELRASGCSYLDNDARCLGVAVGSFRVASASDLIEGVLPEYDRGWYELEPRNTTRMFRWSSSDATISVFNPGNETALNITGSVWSYHLTRKFSIQLNGSTFFETYLPSETRINARIELPSGYSEIIFHSTGCSVPRDVEKSEDPRCLSTAFADLSVEATP